MSATLWMLWACGTLTTTVHTVLRGLVPERGWLRPILARHDCHELVNVSAAVLIVGILWFLFIPWFILAPNSPEGGD